MEGWLKAEMASPTNWQNGMAGRETGTCEHKILPNCGVGLGTRGRKSEAAQM